MTSRRLHKILGLILLLPLFAWGITGLIFYFKPGYGAAYAQLAPKTYPLPENLSLQLQPKWQEARWMHTRLGQHLLVNIEGKWQHLDAQTLAPFDTPDKASLIAFIEDSFLDNPSRYGHVISLEGDYAITSTDIHIRVDWHQLRLQQRGPDTDLIDTLYNIHYLRWSSINRLDQALGLLGIGLLFALTSLGLQLYLRGRRASTQERNHAPINSSADTAAQE